MISNNSNKINLRPIEEADLDLIQNWRNNRSIQPFVREYRELSKTHIKAWFDSSTLDNKFEFFLIEDENKNPIGVTGFTYIDWVSKKADIHIALYEKGWIEYEYTPEVLNVMISYGFNHLNLNRIYAEVFEIDHKKIKLFTSNNFKLDAVLREHHYYDSRYINSHIYSILKSEYTN